jgi:predicted kinase
MELLEAKTTLSTAAPGNNPGPLVGTDIFALTYPQNLGKKLIAMRGLPGSGKSTLVRVFALAFGGVAVVCKDTLRAENPGATEKQIHRLQTDELYRLAATDTPLIVVDNTHLDPRSTQQLAGFARFHGYDFGICEVPTPWLECIMRDAARKERGERYVGRSVIIQMAIRYGLFHMPVKPTIVVDLDGSLCDITHRRHFVAGPGKKDWVGFGAAIPDDTPSPMVAEVVKLLKEKYTILYVSGRNAQYRRATEEWLEKQGLDFHFALFMRGVTDFRDDEIIKEEIYNRYIKDHFDVKLVLDDRARVTNMWRRIGLECWQLAEGNF